MRILQTSACAACKVSGYCHAAEAKEKIVHLFWWKNKADRQRYVEENLPTAYADEIKAWQQRKNDFIAEQERIRKDKDREYLVDYLDEKKPLDLFLTSNPDFIIDGLKEEDVKLNDEIPGGFGLDFSLDLEYQTLYVDLDLPEIEDLDDRYPVETKDGVVYKKKSASEMKKEYAMMTMSPFSIARIIHYRPFPEQGGSPAAPGLSYMTFRDLMYGSSVWATTCAFIR